METKVNIKRLALSLSLFGVILVPLFTGSLARFIKHPVDPAGVWTEMVRDPRDTSFDAFLACYDFHKLDEGCYDSKHPQYYPDMSVSHPYPASLSRFFLPLVRDIAFGLIVPAFLFSFSHACFENIRIG